MFFHKNIRIEKPLISIITVVYNGEKYIEQTIKSVLNQSFKNFEYIIIDGKSDDSTLNIINKYKNKIDIILSQKDKNLWDAVNKGIRLSKGEIVGWISSDDTYTSNALKIISSYFSNNKKIDLLFGSVKKKTGLIKKKKEFIMASILRKYSINLIFTHQLRGASSLRKNHI
jgi:glycosyltransferase involved in cell wall biosynthesis